MARAATANCHSLYGAACANRLHGIGRTGSRRRSGGFRSLSRGSVLARGRGDRSWGNAIDAGRSHQLNEFPFPGRKNTMAGVYDFTARSLAGEDIPLKRFEGQVLLIVNTASACGFTPQYKGLQALHEEFAPRGFSVLGFPCNQFGSQDPGVARALVQFCATNYAITFPMFAKIDLNASTSPLLILLLYLEFAMLLGASIKWNFTK